MKPKPKLSKKVGGPEVDPPFLPPKPPKRSSSPLVWCKRIREDESWALPAREFPRDAGADLTACRHVTVGALQRAQIPTNTAMAISEGHFGLLLPRSSTFHKKGLVVLPGIVDSGFRGEVMMVVYNPHPSKTVYVAEGERLAQVLILPSTGASFKKAEKLEDGERKDRGFGSTGGYTGDL